MKAFVEVQASLKGKKKKYSGKKVVGGQAFLTERVSFMKEPKSLYVLGYKFANLEQDCKIWGSRWQ